MAKTVIVISRTESLSVEEVGNGMSGYRVDLSVESSQNIDPKIFIMHREVISTGDEGEYEDQFYSVASVAQLESIPGTQSDENPFYRVSGISLVFPSKEDLVKYTDKILSLVKRLELANDLVINTSSPVIVSFPPEAGSRFWGITELEAVTDEMLLGGQSDTVYSAEFDKVVSNDGGPRYVYVALKSDLPDLASLDVNGISRATVLVERDVETIDGFLTGYKIYRTTDTISASTYLIETAV